MRVIRVLYDSQIFQLQRHGGISRYFSELIREFREHPELGIEPVLSQRSFLNSHLLYDSGAKGLRPIKSKFKALVTLMTSVFFSRSLQKESDVIHPTFYLPGFLPGLKDKPVVVTLHDMIPEIYPEPSRIWNPHFRKRSYLKKADLVLSVSNSSIQDMKTAMGLELNSVVTHLGVGPEFKAGLEPPSWIKSPFFLFVGNRSGYKDFNTAIHAFSAISKSDSEVRLLLAGGGALTTKEATSLNLLGLTSRVNQRSVSSTELPSLYSNALALLYPTRHEGFGLPLVEAMASQVPIFCSDTLINKEICGGAGNYFGEGDHQALAKLMLSRLEGSEVLKDRLSIGKARAEGFTWRRCAEITASSYRQVVEGYRSGS